MACIYINNFRGFENTFIDLQEINFFVGENSTGKTSILKLIGILGSPNFWRYGEFGDKLKDLGDFSEMITNPRISFLDYFEIGILGEDDDFSAIKMIFIDQNDYPTLKEIRLKNNSINLQIILDGNILKYRLIKDQKKTSNKYIKKLLLFKKWIESRQIYSTEFEKIDIEEKGIIPLLDQISYLLISNKQINKDKKIRIPHFLENIAWFSPIRIQPSKTYDSPTFNFESSGKHSVYVLEKYIMSSSASLNILNKFGTDSGLYDGIVINELNESNQKSKSFQLQFLINNKALNIANVGYGISQILPFVVEVIARPHNSWFMIQQPEIHLHPRAQAALGDFIFKSNRVDGNKFIIETHSDYLIDRYRLKVNKSNDISNSHNKGQVIFFSRSSEGNKIYHILIEEDGSYSDYQPDDFRNFFIKEQLDLLDI